MTRQLSCRTVVLTVAIALSLSCAATGTPVDEDGVCAGGKCDHATPETDLWTQSFQHQWALDMRKVRAKMPRFTDRVVAATRDELKLPQDLWNLACEKERVVARMDNTATGAVTGDRVAVDEEGVDQSCLLYGNTMRVNYDHSWHNDADEVIVNVVDNGSDGLEHYDVPGYLNIIALKNADRTEQGEIHSYLRNGDILVYFHPQDSDTFQYRMHHAAMYYDTGEYDGEGNPIALGLDGERYAHHIDNPVSYGPTFNAGVSSVPFHVYRFNPNGAAGTENRNEAGQYEFKCTADTSSDLCSDPDGTFSISDAVARAYALAARNWAFITNDSAPFASFHKMSWLDDYQRTIAQRETTFMNHVDKFAAPATGGETPEVYCAGLVYTNWNLALNRPMNENSLSEGLLSALQNDSYTFNDNYMQAQFPGTALMQGQENLRTTGQYIFPLATASDIVDSWAEGYFRPMDGKLVAIATGAKAGDPTSIAMVKGLLEQFQLAPEAAGSADTVIEFFTAEQLGTILARAARGGIIHGASEAVSRGFRALREQVNLSADDAEKNHTIATPERVQAYANAYAGGFEIRLSPEQLAASDTADALRVIGEGGLPLVAVDDQGTFSMDRFDIKLDLDRPVGERLVVSNGPDGSPDFLQIKDIEVLAVENRYTPPPIYHWMANRPGSVLSYVGTVFHIDLLHPLTDAAVDGDGVVPEFAEGGPDSSQYKHYTVPNGGRHVQRILTVSAGPEYAGPGSQIMTRISASNLNDVRVVLHPAGTFHVSDRYLCDHRGKARRETGDPNTDCIDLKTQGVLLPLPDRNGATDGDETFRWNLFASDESDTLGNAGCTLDDEFRRFCPSFDWDTMTASEEMMELAPARGMWTVSVIDIGRDSSSVDIRHCEACTEGGAHTNQWFIKLRSDDVPAAPEVAPVLELREVWESTVAASESISRDFVMSEGFVGSINLKVTLTPSSGDADLHVARGLDAVGNIPTPNSTRSGSNVEEVIIVGAQANDRFTITAKGFAYAEVSDFALVVAPNEVTPTEDDALILEFLNTATHDDLLDRADLPFDPSVLIIKGRTQDLNMDRNRGIRTAGPWQSLDDVASIDGIGGGTLRRIRSYGMRLLISAAAQRNADQERILD